MAENITHELHRLRQELAAMKQDAGEITSRADSMERSIEQLMSSLASHKAAAPPDTDGHPAPERRSEPSSRG